MGAMPGVLEVPGGPGGLEVSPWAAGFGEFSLNSQVPKFSWASQIGHRSGWKPRSDLLGDILGHPLGCLFLLKFVP